MATEEKIEKLRFIGEEGKGERKKGLLTQKRGKCPSNCTIFWDKLDDRNVQNIPLLHYESINDRWTLLGDPDLIREMSK